jgi:putative oxidoreductase
MSLSDRLTRYQPNAIAILRIVTSLQYIEHGTQKLFGFPASAHEAVGLSPLFLTAGILEVAGGALLLLGLFTRPVAFLLCGQMAVAYFTVHIKANFFPVNNGGDAAISFCFIFLLLVVTGAGSWSMDKRLRNKP